MEKRCSFELFKSNVCHWLKEEGDIDFLIQVLESDLIRKYYVLEPHFLPVHLLSCHNDRAYVQAFLSCISLHA